MTDSESTKGQTEMALTYLIISVPINVQTKATETIKRNLEAPCYSSNISKYITDSESTKSQI